MVALCEVVLDLSFIDVGVCQEFLSDLSPELGFLISVSDRTGFFYKLPVLQADLSLLDKEFLRFHFLIINFGTLRIYTDKQQTYNNYFFSGEC